MNILDAIEGEIERVTCLAVERNAENKSTGAKHDISALFVARGEAWVALAYGDTFEIVEAYNQLKAIK